jgi:hypothetical protein
MRCDHISATSYITLAEKKRMGVKKKSKDYRNPGRAQHNHYPLSVGPKITVHETNGMVWAFDSCGIWLN